jgi:hypothetical protein
MTEEEREAFWRGYHRPPNVRYRLVMAINAALVAYPDQRFGQLLLNVLGDADLWQVYDEDVITALQKCTNSELAQEDIKGHEVT